MRVARVVAGLWLMAMVGCGARDTSQAGQEAAAAARDSVARADSIRKIEAAKELTVTHVMIGKRIGQGNRVTEPTFQFAPADTVYVSIGTMGSPDSAAFEARWINQKGERVDSSEATLRPTGRDIVLLKSFRAKGWPPGAYRITIYADGDSVESRTFAVQRQQ